MSLLRTTSVAMSALVLASCEGRVPITTFLFANYERTLDAYEQSDVTTTDVTSTQATDGRDVHLISAFFGLDNALPRFSNRFVCEGADFKDGMPVVFSHEVDLETVEPGDFKVTQSSGAIGTVTCLTLAPADDPGELRTVLLAGEFGSADDQPIRVEIVGNVLSLEGSANFRGADIDVTPLETGPTMVWAEIVPERDWALGTEGTDLPFGGGTKCPLGTQQIVRVTWNGGITKPGGAPADDVERLLYRVEVMRDTVEGLQITPWALADLNDGDNNHLLCLDTNDPVRSVSFPSGHVTDPREDLNPATTISLTER